MNWIYPVNPDSDNNVPTSFNHTSVLRQGCVGYAVLPIIEVPGTKGRLAQWLERLVHTEEAGGSNPPSPTTWQEVARRGGGTADALRSGRSVLTDVWVQIPPSAPNRVITRL